MGIRAVAVVGGWGQASCDADTPQHTHFPPTRLLPQPTLQPAISLISLRFRAASMAEPHQGRRHIGVGLHKLPHHINMLLWAEHAPSPADNTVTGHITQSPAWPWPNHFWHFSTWNLCTRCCQLLCPWSAVVECCLR